MYKKPSLLFLFIISFYTLNAQILPGEGKMLNYRLIGFSFPPGKYPGSYKIEIAMGGHTTESSFEQHIIKATDSRNNKIIIEVPYFGAQYTWRVSYANVHSAKTKKSSLHHFSTGIVPVTDTNVNRLRIINPAQKYSDAYVFVDAPGVLYDMNGRPVWYLPNIGARPGNVQIRDLKLSPFGTITFIKGSRIYEIDYDGNVLWEKPGADNGNSKLDTINNLYHHEFTRLKNGHYMVMGSEQLLCKLPVSKDSSFSIVTDSNIKSGNTKNYSRIPFGTLIEYDEDGNVVWIWHTSKYVMESDLLYNEVHNSITDLHDNSFFFDEQNKTVYISFKGVSRVIKVKYPEGNVLNTYGVIYDRNNNFKYQLDIQENRNPLFCGQHACRYSERGYLYLFNNGCDLNTLSEIVVMQEPADNNRGQNGSMQAGGGLKKIWEYECRVDDIGQQLAIQPNTGGGNVIELPDQSLFVSMGYQCSKLFIVNINKEIFWSAIFETQDQSLKTWKTVPSYRSSIIINRKEMERLIWSSGNHYQSHK